MKKKQYNLDAKEGKWYEITEGYFTNTCCGCGLEHIIQVCITPNHKVGIRFFQYKNQTEKQIKKLLYPKYP